MYAYSCANGNIEELLVLRLLTIGMFYVKTDIFATTLIQTWGEGKAMLLPRVRWDGSLLLQLDQPSSLSLDLYNYLPSMGNFQILLLLFSKIFNLYCNTPAISYCLGKKKTKSYGREGQISVLRNLSSTLALVMAMLGLLFIGLAWLKVARVGSESDLPWSISFKIKKKL